MSDVSAVIIVSGVVSCDCTGMMPIEREISRDLGMVVDVRSKSILEGIIFIWWWDEAIEGKRFPEDNNSGLSDSMQSERSS